MCTQKLSPWSYSWRRKRILWQETFMEKESLSLQWVSEGTEGVMDDESGESIEEEVSFIGKSINQSFLYWHMTKRICWHLIQNCNTRKVNRNLYTACGLRSFYRSSVMCDRASVCQVDDAADCTAVSPSTGAGAVHAGRGLNCCWFF